MNRLLSFIFLMTLLVGMTGLEQTRGQAKTEYALRFDGVDDFNLGVNLLHLNGHPHSLDSPKN